MIKPASLRAAIVVAVPDLEANPDKLQVFVDAGNLVATNTKSLSFEYRYTINLILLDFAGNEDTVMMALLVWIRRYQSDLLDNADKRSTAITFEVDQLSNSTCDLSIKLPLTESVKVQLDAGGKPVATHLDEPVPEWATPGTAG